MKVTDYIIEFLIDKNVTDIFGYPGGAICHLIDSASKYKDRIKVHTNYHEQASSFSACAYAQESLKLGVAFSTSGPGATNLATGIANAYYDSIPVMFITGQVDTYSLKGKMHIRQNGFQETDIVSMFKPITKYSIRVDNPEDIVYEIHKAYDIAISGNPGPVLIDLPADVQRVDIDISKCKEYMIDYNSDINYDVYAKVIIDKLSNSFRPCLIVGNGVKQSGCKNVITELVNKLGIPTVFSMPAVDTLIYNNEYNYGFIGANGHRYANFVVGKSDLIITIGTRMDLKQVGSNRLDFAKGTKIIRIDIDEGNFENSIHDEVCIKADIKLLLPKLLKHCRFRINKKWIDVCQMIKNELSDYDNEEYHYLIKQFCKFIPEHTGIVADVGQSAVWVAQQLQIKNGQTFHISSGHGAMGYSLPAAIGTYYGGKDFVCSFNGDGGVQMNIQELQFIKREKLPIWVIIINNQCLGMIRGFQEANFDKNYAQTIEGKGYLSPNFKKIAEAYDMEFVQIISKEDLQKLNVLEQKPTIIEIVVKRDTLLKPNFGKNGFIQDQRPYLDRNIYNKLMEL